MTANEYVELFLKVKTEQRPSTTDEQCKNEFPQWVSGIFVCSLCEALVEYEEDQGAIDEITNHIEELHDSANYIGVIYFIIFLAETINFTLPKEFIEMSMRIDLAPELSAAIVDDWLEASF